MYPPPPWHTHGRAWVQPFAVDARAIELPAGFRAQTIAGRCVGFLALIEYVAPSPLEYAELTWMPCGVTAAGVRGHFISRMYVDSDDSLQGGRELWAIPKQRARFAIADDRAVIRTDDGAHLELGLVRRGPALPLRAGAGTLQPDGAQVVRFRGSGTARTASGGLRVLASSGTQSWPGFATAHRLRGAGAALTEFAITMHPARRLSLQSS